LIEIKFFSDWPKSDSATYQQIFKTIFILIGQKDEAPPFSKF
jgi:hypothetical protein